MLLCSLHFRSYTNKTYTSIHLSFRLCESVNFIILSYDTTSVTLKNRVDRRERASLNINSIRSRSSLKSLHQISPHAAIQIFLNGRRWESVEKSTKSLNDNRDKWRGYWNELKSPQHSECSIYSLLHAVCCFDMILNQVSFVYVQQIQISSSLFHAWAYSRRCE